MKTLDQIGIEHQTDKASQFTRTYAKPHDYLRHMEKFFEPLRHEPIKFLEIGAAGGESIKTWLEYFDHPDARIFGVDIVSNTNPYNTNDPITRSSGVDPRYTFCQGDQGDHVFWKCFLASYGGDWNIVVDDGSHFNRDIIHTFNALWPSMASKGIYCVEDLGVAFGAGSIFLVPGYPNHFDWLKSKVDDINLNGSIDAMYFSKELCILRKP